MLASKPSVSNNLPIGTGPSSVARLFRERVAPCGLEPLRQLEAGVEAKLAAVRELEAASADRFPQQFRAVVRGVLSARSDGPRIVAETNRTGVQAAVKAARTGYLGPAQLTEVADRLAGAPEEVLRDVASELLHGGAPDRVSLLARWVWNPSRRTGVLAELGAPTADSYAHAQARLGEIRLELGTLGFPCASFAGVDVVLALTYAARLQLATDGQLRSGGLESLLPGAYPLAAMILGVRRQVVDADR
jgi:hypothetical protein